MTTLAYTQLGSGPPLVILHGLFGDKSNWGSIAKPLSNHYTIYLLDLINHGQSPHTPKFSYPNQASYVKNTLDELGLTNIRLMGHSMGGKVSMQLAHDYPDLISHLIVVDIAPKTYPDHHRSILNGLCDMPIENIQYRQDADAFLEPYVQDKLTRLFLLKNLLRDPEGKYHWQLNVHDISKKYQQIAEAPHLSHAVPLENVLFIRGDKSSYVLDPDIELCKKWFPNSKIETIHGATHWVHSDKPAELLALCEAALS